MISRYLYLNNYEIYRPSSSVSPEGDIVETGSLYASGKGRLEPAGGKENTYDFNFYCDYVNLNEVDTLFVDSIPYNVINVQDFSGQSLDHHLEVKLQYIT